MTLYWKTAGIVRKLLPEVWLRSWFLDYVRETGFALVERGDADCSIVANRKMLVIVSGGSYHLHRDDIMKLTTNGRVTPITAVAE